MYCLHVCLYNERDVFFCLRVMHSQRLNCRIASWAWDMSQETAPSTTLAEVHFLPKARHVRLALLHIYNLNLGSIVQNHTFNQREVRVQSDGMIGEWRMSRFQKYIGR